MWCKLIHVGILHVKVGWCGRVIQTISLDNAILFFPPNSLTRFPPWGDLSKNQSYATLDECYAWQIYADHTWVPNRKIWDFPLFARKKLCWVHWTFFVTADFMCSFSHEIFPSRLHKHVWEQMHGPLFVKMRKRSYGPCERLHNVWCQRLASKELG